MDLAKDTINALDLPILDEYNQPNNIARSSKQAVT